MAEVNYQLVREIKQQYKGYQELETLINFEIPKGYDIERVIQIVLENAAVEANTIQHKQVARQIELGVAEEKCEKDVDWLNIPYLVALRGAITSVINKRLGFRLVNQMNLIYPRTEDTEYLSEKEFNEIIKEIKGMLREALKV